MAEMGAIMKTYRYNAPGEITEDQIRIIVESSFDAIEYWVDGLRPYRTKGFKSHKQAVDWFMSGKEFQFRVSETGRWRGFDINRLIRGLKNTKNQNFESYDLSDVDKLVQVSMFGKIIYG